MCFEIRILFSFLAFQAVKDFLYIQRVFVGSVLIQSVLSLAEPLQPLVHCTLKTALGHDKVNE